MMQNFRRNELIDNLYERYLETFSKTLDSIDSTGVKVYDFYLNYLCKCLKCDVKQIDKTMIKYNKYLRKKRKYEIRIDKLRFSRLKKLKVFRLKRFKKRHYKFLQKYFIFIPIEEYENEIKKLNK